MVCSVFHIQLPHTIHVRADLSLLFFLQGDLGPQGVPGPSGPTGQGIQGEKVSNCYVEKVVYLSFCHTSCHIHVRL